MIFKRGLRQATPTSLVASALVTLVVLATVFGQPLRAVAQTPAALPPVLILDAGLGDESVWSSYWLGEAHKTAETDSGLELSLSTAPKWFRGNDLKPATYLLAARGGSLDEAAIVWALDRIAEQQKEPRAVLMCQGLSGLQALRYVEDVGDTKQSARADVVGLIFLGTPVRGLSLSQQYPRLDIWGTAASNAGLTVDDIGTGSSLIGQLGHGVMPTAIKTLVVSPSAVTIGPGRSDGMGLTSEFSLPASMTLGTLDNVSLQARASQNWSFKNTWSSLTKRGGALSPALSGDDLERLAVAPGLPIVPALNSAVTDYYRESFSAGAPITHISSRLVIDVSGSMRERFGDGTKLVAAQSASRDFAESLADRQSIKGYVPEDCGIVAFNEKPVTLVSPTDSVRDLLLGLKGMKASGNTDLGKAIGAAVESLEGSPLPANKVIVLLSDGVSTKGLNKSRILSGPVRLAKKRGIRIETIALGSKKAKSADVDFLKRVSKSTGGSFHQAKDRFELRRDFVRAHFSTIGTLTVDRTFKNPAPIEIGKLGDDVKRLEAGIVAEKQPVQWQITRDGVVLDPADFRSSTSRQGVTYLTVLKPVPGEYKIVPSTSGRGRQYAFLVINRDVFRRVQQAPPDDSLATILLFSTGGACLLAVLGTVVMSLKKRPAEQTAGMLERQEGE